MRSGPLPAIALHWLRRLEEALIPEADISVEHLLARAKGGTPKMLAAHGDGSTALSADEEQRFEQLCRLRLKRYAMLFP